MDNQDVENFINGAMDFIGTLFGGVQAALEVIPPIVTGFIVIILLIIWAYHAAKD